MNKLTSFARLLSALLVASGGVTQAGTIAPPSATAVGDVQHHTNVGSTLDTIDEQLKRLSVSLHNLAEMRDGLSREDFTDNERARLGDIFAIANAFRKSLSPVLFVGPLIAKMRLPEDAEIVGQTFYFTARSALLYTESDVRDIDRYMTDIHNATALAQVAKVRDAMTALRDILQAVPHFDKDATH
jgi:hypothetical protein